MSHQVDALIVTVKAHETKAILGAFKAATGFEAQALNISRRIYYRLGTLNGTNFYLAISEQGSGGIGGAHQTVSKAIATLRPKIVIAAGIAFGIDSTSQRIGDILISKQLALYDAKRVGATQTLYRGDRAHASPFLVNAFDGFAQSFSERRVKTGLLLSGEELVDSIDHKAKLLQMEPEAIGGEMEGAGIYVASNEEKVDWIVIKAICDWADGKKNDSMEERQKQAAESAANFLVEAVTRIPLLSVDPPQGWNASSPANVVRPNFVA